MKSFLKRAGKSLLMVCTFLGLMLGVVIPRAGSDEPSQFTRFEGTVLAKTFLQDMWRFNVTIQNHLEGAIPKDNPTEVEAWIAEWCQPYIDPAIEVGDQVEVYGIPVRTGLGTVRCYVDLCTEGGYIKKVSCCVCGIGLESKAYYPGDPMTIQLNFCGPPEGASAQFNVCGRVVYSLSHATIEGCNTVNYVILQADHPDLYNEVTDRGDKYIRLTDVDSSGNVDVNGYPVIDGYGSIEEITSCGNCPTRDACDPDEADEAYTVRLEHPPDEPVVIAGFEQIAPGFYTRTISAPGPGTYEVVVEAPNCGSKEREVPVYKPGEVFDCMEISAPGTYTLMDLIDNSAHAGCCIKIMSSDVTFNGNDKYIDGVEQDNTIGICVGDLGSDPIRNVTVKNISRVSDWTTGIRVQNVESGGGPQARVEDNTVWYNEVGIWVVGSSAVVVAGNDVRGNSSYGIVLTGSDQNDVRANTVEGNFDGIFLIDSHGNTLTGNASQANYSNIGLSASTGNEIAGNIASGGAYGIDLYANSNSNTITANTVQINNWDGIFIDSGTGNTVSNNLVCYNNRNPQGGTYYDIHDKNANSGDQNICDMALGWTDLSVGENCTFECHDRDGDGVDNDADNCPDVYNPDQTNTDTDPMGDACDTDMDNDGVPDKDEKLKPIPPSQGGDNCPWVKNADQGDMDGDDIGDACDDSDEDGILDLVDNCPFEPNPNQENADGDETGDVCDDCTDTDGDGYGDPGFPVNTCAADNCPDEPNPNQEDSDGDGAGNACDNCPDTENADQADMDDDGIGDVCDDSDEDGYFDANDNCPFDTNSDQKDTDDDGQGDVCDSDRDGDGRDNDLDNCPDHVNACQSDTDGDGWGDACDPVIALSPDPNPADSTIMAGGTVYRYYRVVEACGSPWSGVVATVEHGAAQAAAGPSGPDGILAVGLDADDLGSPGQTVTCSITLLDGEPITPVDFNVKINHREYEKTWEGGLSISGGARASVQGVNASAGGGLTLKLKDRDPSSVATDDTISIGRKYSAEAGASVGSSTGASATIGPATAGAELSAEVGLSLIALLGDSYEFTDPYGDDALIAETGLLLATYYDMANKFTNPVMSEIISWIMGYVTGYNAYLKEQVGELGLKIQAGASAVTGLGTDFESTDQQSGDLLPSIGIGFGSDIDGSLAGYVAGGTRYDEDLDGDGQVDGDTIMVGTRLEGQLDTSVFVGVVATEGDEMKKVIGDVLSGGEAGSVEFQIIYTDSGALHGVEIKYCETKNYGFGITTDDSGDTLSGSASTGATLCGSLKYGAAEAQQVIDELVDVALTGVSSLVFGPSAFVGALEDLANNVAALSCDTEVGVKNGDGFTFPVSFALGASGIGDLSLGFEIKLDRTVEYKERVGVLRGGNGYTLEDYGLVTWPTVDQGTSFSDIAATGFDKVLEKASGLVQAVQQAINEAGEAVLEAADKTADFFVDLGEGAAGTLIGLIKTGKKIWPFAEGAYVMQQDGPGQDVLIGITGYYMLTPEGTTVPVSGNMTLYYDDADLNGYSEADLAVYAWDLITEQWIYLGGVVDPENNTVTADFQVFTTFALGWPFPSGKIDLTPSRAPVEPGQTLEFNSSAIQLSTGSPVPDGTLVTVTAIKGATFGTASFGTIQASDADVETDGLQVATTGGTVSFTYVSPDEYGIARVMIESVAGTAKGEYRLNVVQAPSPGDSDRDTRVDLADAILSLQLCSGMTPRYWVDRASDVNGDERVGPDETIYILQKVARIR